DHRYLSRPSIDEVVAACQARPARPAHPAPPARPPRAGAAVRLLVGAGSCGLARGARATLEALRAAFPDADVRAGACPGLCYAAAVVDVLRPGAPGLTAERVTPDRIPALRRLLDGAGDHGLAGAAWADAAVAGLPPVAAHPALGGQQRLLAARWNA